MFVLYIDIFYFRQVMCMGINKAAVGIMAVMTASIATPAYAVCPLCIFGAAAGVATAVHSKNFWVLGVWSGTLVCALLAYFLHMRRQYMSMLVSTIVSVFAALVLCMFCVGVSLLISIDPAGLLGQLRVGKNFMQACLGVSLGAMLVYVMTVLSCVIKTWLHFSFPFMRMTIVLTAAYLLTLI